MAARAMGTATVSFGLVAIPVKVYSTTKSSSSISFRQIDKVTGARVKQKLVSSKDGREVPRSDLVKGYEIAKDQYILFEPEEIKAVEAKATKSIDIQEFVPVDLVDPVYFDKPYYLGPDKGGSRPYALLKEALLRSELAALAQYANRGKQYLVLIRAVDDGLVMQQLRYADEIRPWSEVPLGDPVEVKEQELTLAQQIVAMNTSDAFEPDKYEDTVRQALEEMIQARVDGHAITVGAEEEPQAQVIDLMAALKASLEAKDDRKEARRAPRDEADEAEAASGGE